MFIINNLNDPGAGLLDNDKNGDGIPDFVFPIREISLKVQLFKTIGNMREYIQKNDSMCFGVSLDHSSSSEYHATFHFDDSTSPLGRT